MKTLLFFALFLCTVARQLTAQTPDFPELIDWQGYLTEGGTPLSGSVNLMLSLYNVASGGTALFTENLVGVTVDNGVVNAVLGRSSPFPALLFDQKLYLGVRVNGGAELAPRTPLHSVPYAYKLRGLRLATAEDGQYQGWNVLTGYFVNGVASGVVGGTIAGGGAYHIPTGRVLPNTVTGDFGSIGGGMLNSAGNMGTVAGGQENVAEGDNAAVGGGRNNRAALANSVVAGGESNMAGQEHSTVGGGRGNVVGAKFGTISGGQNNFVYDRHGVIGGGLANVAGIDDGDTYSQTYATVGGGTGNSASGGWSTVAGGVNNVASGTYATVAGGGNNVAVGDRSVVLGGTGNQANATFSLAAGMNAHADHAGSFIWSDNKMGDVLATTGAQQFIVRSSGGVWFFTNWAKTAGVTLPSGSGSWASVSSEAAKSDFEAVDEQAVLDGVATLDIHRWRYNEEDPAVRHMGPVSEDFYEVFGLGQDAEHIVTIDADGVSLAAIQALYRLVREQQAEIQSLRGQVDELMGALR